MNHRNLDHFVVAVKDLDRASRAYQRLGFAVMPRMHHAAIGTSNHVVQFHDTYLELIGNIDQCFLPALRQQMQKRLDSGDGLSINCLTSSSLVADRAHLMARGHACDPILSARRQVVMPDGSTDETASDCFYVWRNDERLWSTLFYSQHNKPQVIWIAQWQVHPNTVMRTLGMTYVSNDLSADEPYFSDLFQGAPAERSADHLGYRTPRGQTFEVLSRGRLARRYGRHAPPATALAVVGVGLRYGVSDLERCRRVLTEGAVPFGDENGVLTVGAEHACGVVTEFVQQP